MNNNTVKKEAVILAIYNNKGGIGKTTFATNFAHSIVKDFKKEDGNLYKVLVIDNDGQSNATLMLTGKSEDYIAENCTTIFDLVTDEDVLAKDCIINTKYDNISIIPSDDNHNDTPDAIASEFDNTRILSNKIKDIKTEFDFIIIDCAPTKDRNVYNALFAADVVITPLDTQLFSRVGLRNLLKHINKVNKKRTTPLLHYAFLNKVDNRQKKDNELIKNELINVLDTDFMLEYMSSLPALYSKALRDGYTIVNYPNANNARDEITALTKRILTKIEEELI